MKFINFTQHVLTPEQLKAAQIMGATKIINIPDPSRFNDNQEDDGTSSYKLVEKIAKEIAELIGNDNSAIVHFPISSPYVMSLFWKKYGYIQAKMPKCKVESYWRAVVVKARFVFSHTDRVTVEEPQPDGSVIKKSVFKFIKFVG